MTATEHAAALIRAWRLDRADLDAAARALGVAALTDTEWRASNPADPPTSA